MKSALGIMGESALSEWAMTLEEAGRAKDMQIIDKETDMFVHALKDVVLKLTPTNNTGNFEMSTADNTMLREKMATIRVACEMFEKKAIKGLLSQLKQKEWPDQINEILNDFTFNLLHSNFEGILDDVNEMLSII
jgi:hypothetical protein